MLGLHTQATPLAGRREGCLPPLPGGRPAGREGSSRVQGQADLGCWCLVTKGRPGFPRTACVLEA